MNGGPQFIEYSFGICTNYLNGECSGEIIRTGYSEYTYMKFLFPHFESSDTRAVLVLRNREGITNTVYK